MSHGAHDGHRKVYQRVREMAARFEKPVAILADLCGPKIRVGAFENGHIELKVREIEGDDIACEVIAGGILSDHKGMNLPGVQVSAPSLTAADRVDAAALEDPNALARETVLAYKLAEKGQTILLVQGYSTDPAENMPSVTVVTV